MARDTQRNEKLFEKADLPRIAQIMSQLDEQGRNIILKGLASKLDAKLKTDLINQVKTLVLTHDAQVQEWLKKGVSNSYVFGVNATDAELRGKGIGGIAKGEITVEELKTEPSLRGHLAVVNNILSEAYMDFGNTMNGYVRGAERILNEAMKQQMRAKIASGALTGSSIDKIKRDVKNTIADGGFTVLEDRGGNEWTLGRYSEMLARTQIIRSSNEAQFNRAVEHGVDIVEITTHGAVDSLCAPEEGKFYSLSGKSENYPPIAGHEPPYHPNCTHHMLMHPELE